MSTIIPGLSGLDTATAWRALQKDPQKYIDSFTKSNKQLKSDADYFTKKLAAVTTPADLFKDQRAMKYLLESFGLGSETNSLGLIKKVLSEDPTASGSLSSQLADTRYSTMAKALRLDKGLDTLKSVTASGALSKNYIQNEFEETLGDQDNALRQAAYFARNANNISDIYSVLGDKVLRDVVTTTFSLPKALAVQEIESQAKVVAARVDVTKFKSATSTTSISATQLARAKSDHDLIGTNLAISDAAVAQMKKLQDQLGQLSTGYGNLDAVTDPNGANHDDIALQQSAVPNLIRYNQLLTAGNSAVDSISANLTTLNGLITQAKASGSDIAALKTQFSTLITSINDKINGAAIAAPDGTTQNILLNGTADTVTTTFDTSGHSVTINRYDATSIQSVLNDAQTAFNAVTGSGDSSNLLAAQGRLLRAQDGINAINTKIDSDTTAMNSAVSTGFFAATLNTAALSKGQQSVTDGLTRITQVESLLTQIGTLATQSAALADGADRSALETQFTALKMQLHSAIETTGTGLDNYLNNIPDTSYEIINGQTVTVKGGFDLKAQIADVMDTQSLSTVADAQALKTKTVQVTTYSDRAKASLTASKATVDGIISNYDPRGKLDSQLYALKANLSSFIAGAAKNNANLLGAGQTDIKLNSLSTGTVLTFRAQPSFGADFLSAVNGVIGQFGNSTGDILNALDDVVSVVNRAKQSLDSDNRFATLEYGKLGGTIDVLDPKNTDATSTLYQTNSFTAKFITRYLAQNALTNGSGGGTSSYVSALFGTSDSSTSIANIMSLAVSLKA